MAPGYGREEAGQAEASTALLPKPLTALYKTISRNLLKRRIPNHTLFEAYVQYCFSPKHTTGEQLLEVRRDKREREAFASVTDSRGLRSTERGG